MSIFGNNTTFLERYDSSSIPADISYSGFTGIANILIENAINDQAIFEAVIADDFRELMGRSVLEASDIIALNESRVSEFFKKIKILIDKFIAKIKGFFKNIIDKFRKKGKENVEDLLKKYDYGKKYTGKGVNIKYRKPVDKEFSDVIEGSNGFIEGFDDIVHDIFNSTSESQINSILDEVKSHNDMLKGITKDDTIDACFEDAKEIEVSEIKEKIISIIKNYESDIKIIQGNLDIVVKSLNKTKSTLDKMERSHGKNIEISDDELNSIYSDQQYKDGSHSKDSSLFAIQINSANKVIQTTLDNVSRYAIMNTTVFKFRYNQAVAAFKVLVSEPVTESACIIDAIMESSMYEDSLYFE